MEPSNVDPKRLFIVVIDDSETVCTMLETILTPQGHQVTCFLDPVDALRSILKTCETPLPDLLYIDLTLPRMDGYEVIKRFKSHQATQHIPIIVISRLGNTVARLKTRLAGANAFLEKPFQVQVVLMLTWSVTALTNQTTTENK